MSLVSADCIFGEYCKASAIHLHSFGLGLQLDAPLLTFMKKRPCMTSFKFKFIPYEVCGTYVVLHKSNKLTFSNDHIRKLASSSIVFKSLIFLLVSSNELSRPHFWTII